MTTELTKKTFSGSKPPEPYNDSGQWVAKNMGCTANVVVVTPT